MNPISAPSNAAVHSSLFHPRERVLFQGDSITDGGRGRTEDLNHILGHGYVLIISAWEGANFSDRRLTFLNRGISGHTSTDLAARWKPDTLDLNPDVLSILIGVNDVNQALRADQDFSVEEYAKRYNDLLSETIAALPQVKLILGEPFFGLGSGTNAKIDRWKEIMPQMSASLAALAQTYRVPMVRYQVMFDAAAERAPMEYWIWDGIHPTFSGHQLMADEWRKVYRAFYGGAGNTNP